MPTGRQASTAIERAVRDAAGLGDLNRRPSCPSRLLLARADGLLHPVIGIVEELLQILARHRSSGSLAFIVSEAEKWLLNSYPVPALRCHHDRAKPS